jgi:hypothetical protein
MGRIIITIDEIIAGKGLHSNKGTQPPSIEVSCGKGIQFGEDNEVCVHNGVGLGFGDAGELNVLPEELAGCGLVLGMGSQINIDTTSDPALLKKIRLVTDNRFVMDGYRLVFCTTYTTFNVLSNCVGVVIGFEEDEVVVEKQPLNIDGYGYGNAPVSVVPNSTIPEKPSFYK